MNGQKQLKVRIRRDVDPINWREEGEPVGRIVYTSTRYCLGDERVDDPQAYLLGLCSDEDQEAIEEWEENYPESDHTSGSSEWQAYWAEFDRQKAAKIAEAVEKVQVVLPVYAYIHSGITISTGPFTCQWDSGQSGIIHAPKDHPEFGGDVGKIKACLEAEIKSFDRYLQGDIWGFEIYSVSTCDHGHEHEEVVDSCWGFEIEDEDDAVTAVSDHAGDQVTEEQIREAWRERE